MIMNDYYTDYEEKRSIRTTEYIIFCLTVNYQFLEFIILILILSNINNVNKRY